MKAWLNDIQAHKGSRISTHELRLLTYLYVHPEPFTAADCHLGLYQQGTPINYTSLYSILRRLANSGILEVDSQQTGRQQLYTLPERFIR